MVPSTELHPPGMFLWWRSTFDKSTILNHFQISWHSTSEMRLWLKRSAPHISHSISSSCSNFRQTQSYFWRSDLDRTPFSSRGWHLTTRLKENMNAAPFIKASVRETKAYLKSVNSSALVSYASTDGGAYTIDLAYYLTCGEPETSVDLYGARSAIPKLSCQCAHDWLDYCFKA